jgi:hypothetical protein
MAKNSKPNRTDLKGIVRVTVALENAEEKRVKGNRVRTFRVSAATVTEVGQSLEQVFERPDIYTLERQ